jgi:hypothetical protein
MYLKKALETPESLFSVVLAEPLNAGKLAKTG